jgi:hypothetical protein
MEASSHKATFRQEYGVFPHSSDFLDIMNGKVAF